MSQVLIDRWLMLDLDRHLARLDFQALVEIDSQEARGWLARLADALMDVPAGLVIRPLDVVPPNPDAGEAERRLQSAPGSVGPDSPQAEPSHGAGGCLQALPKNECARRGEARQARAPET